MKQERADPQKIQLRRSVLDALACEPYVLDCYAGEGVLYKRLYKNLRGCAIDRKERFADRAARQRPGWLIYCGDAVSMIAAGLLFFRPIHLLDIDGNASAVPAVLAFLRSERERPARFAVVATDRINPRVAFPDDCKLADPDSMMEFYDAHLYNLLRDEGLKIGYKLSRWRYCTSETSASAALWTVEYSK